MISDKFRDTIISLTEVFFTEFKSFADECRNNGYDDDTMFEGFVGIVEDKLEVNEVNIFRANLAESVAIILRTLMRESDKIDAGVRGWDDYEVNL